MKDTKILMNKIICIFLIAITCNSLAFAINVEELQTAKSQGKKLLIKDIRITDIDAERGINFEIEWAYLEDSHPIKFIFFKVRPFNDAGEVQSCKIKGHTDMTAEVSGPIKASVEKFRTIYWKAAWYNSTITCIELVNVRVIYKDGSSYTYFRELPNILTKDMNNSCKKALE